MLAVLIYVVNGAPFVWESASMFRHFRQFPHVDDMKSIFHTSNMLRNSDISLQLTVMCLLQILRSDNWFSCGSTEHQSICIQFVRPIV